MSDPALTYVPVRSDVWDRLCKAHPEIRGGDCALVTAAIEAFIAAPRWIKADPDDPSTWPPDTNDPILTYSVGGRGMWEGRAARRVIKAGMIQDGWHWMPWSAIGDPS